MLNGLYNRITTDLAVDLGTANTVVYAKGRGIVLNEPSMVAVRQENGRAVPVAYAQEARQMLGRTPMHIEARRPVRDGVIADDEAAAMMFRHYIEKARQGWNLIGPRMVVCVPAGASKKECKAIEKAARAAGAREVLLIEEPVAAAIGAGLPVRQPHGVMILDIGGGTSEVAILSMGGVVYAASMRVGGDRMDQAIFQLLRDRHHLLVGEGTAEHIKKTIAAAAFPSSFEELEMEVRGRHLESGHPFETVLRESEVVEAVQPLVEEIIEAAQTALRAAPPELTADIMERGIVLTGGGALLRHLDYALRESTGLPVLVADDPLLCVALGTGRALEKPDTYRGLLFRA